MRSLNATRVEDSTPQHMPIKAKNLSRTVVHDDDDEDPYNGQNRNRRIESRGGSQTKSRGNTPMRMRLEPLNHNQKPMSF